MIFNSKSFIIQVFIALTILGSNLTSSVNVAAVSPARQVMGSLLPRIYAGQVMEYFCSTIKSTMTCACKANDPGCKNIMIGISLICAKGDESDHAIAKADSNTINSVLDFCNTIQKQKNNVPEICNNFGDSANNAACKMLLTSIGDSCQTVISKHD